MRGSIKLKEENEHGLVKRQESCTIHNVPGAAILLNPGNTSSLGKLISSKVPNERLTESFDRSRKQYCDEKN